MNPNIPFTVYIEATPNPNSMKFVANKMILEHGTSAQYNAINETGDAPLPQALFEFPFTKQVFISSNYITILKHDYLSWDDFVLETRNFVSDYLNSDKPIIIKLSEKAVPVDNSFTTTKNVVTQHAIPTNEVETKIIEVLEQYIRPAVEQDGGLITFHSLKDGVVTVQLRGSCSGCPSSTATLKGGIEALLVRLLPDHVTEVVSEAL